MSGITFACLIIALFQVSAADEKYTTKYDNVDIDAILHNDRLLNKYVDCVLATTDSGCSNDGRELKRNIPEALVTDCSKCSDMQKEMTDKVLKYLMEEKPTTFRKFEEKFDPSGSYRKKHQEVHGNSNTSI